MRLRTLSRLLGSSLIVAGTMVGCSGARMENRPAIAATQASGIALGIEKALAAKDYARALIDAERFVTASPREAAARTLLGRAYLANGRYASARTAFTDALTLGSSDPRAIVSLALVETGLGNAAAARELLIRHIADLPASDYGLAMAISGNPNEGVRALLQAVNLPGADVRTRQNLAYALALTGQWGQARLVAGQDLSGRDLQDRLARWAATAQAEAMPQRVFAMTGVAPRADDGGMPVRLALDNNVPQDVLARTSTASPEHSAPEDLPAPRALAVADANAPLISAAPTPFREAAEPRVAGSSTSAKVKVREPVPAAPPAPAPTPLKRTVLPASSAAPVDDNDPPAASIGSDWVVQIGAFGDATATNRAWQQALRKGFAKHRRIESRFAHAGKTWHRIALGGFEGRGGALAYCASLRAQGQACFVRQDKGLAGEIQMARANAARTETLGLALVR